MPDITTSDEQQQQQQHIKYGELVVLG
ncbi:unnamed protein product, partial [Rotaria sp. Silwood2]